MNKIFTEIGNRAYKLKLIQRLKKIDDGYFQKKTNSKWWQFWLREWHPVYSITIEYGTNKVIDDTWIEGRDRRDIEEITIIFSSKEERDKDYNKVILELNE